MSRVLAAVTAACVIAQSACLASTHRIPPAELARIAATPPAQRGAAVRVIQEWGGEQPPAADPVSTETRVVIVPDVHVGVSVGGGPARPRPPQGTRPVPSGGGGKGGGGGGKGLAGGSADEAWVLVIVAAGFGIYLAATEGSRYDGWVDLHPMHPVHLFGPGGYTVMPLAYIDPQTAAWTERAVVRPSEGPWHRRGRAPLSRRGFSYTVLAGAGTAVSADGSDGVGGAARIQIGYFPVHAFGVQFDWGFTARDNAVGQTLFDHRVGVEATFAPLDAGRLHGGLFGGVARAWRLEDGVVDGRDDGVAISGGAIVQLGVTTYLALTARFGASRAYGDLSQEVLGGISIY